MTLAWDRLRPEDLTPPKRLEAPDPILELLREAGIEHPTLQDWLDANGIEGDDADDAELLEILPAEFADEFMERVRRRRRSIP